MKEKIKKIIFGSFSITKIFYIKFCSMKEPTTKILPNLQGTGKRRIQYIGFNYTLLFNQTLI